MRDSYSYGGRDSEHSEKYASRISRKPNRGLRSTRSSGYGRRVRDARHSWSEHTMGWCCVSNCHDGHSIYGASAGAANEPTRSSPRFTTWIHVRNHRRAYCGRWRRDKNDVGVILGLFLFGNGQASNLLSRYAATDLAQPNNRAAAMSRILFASTFGAVFGPLLIRPAEQLGMSLFGWNQYTGPWVFSGNLLFHIFNKHHSSTEARSAGSCGWT
jgi:hypothetical protein